MNLLSILITATARLQGDDVAVVPLKDEVRKGAGALKALEGLSFDDAITKIANSLVDFAFKLVIAILVFYVGRFVIRRLYRMIRSVMVGRSMDASLTTFVLSLVKMVLYFILIVTIVGILGIETSSFLAIFASAGVAIGMALSGTLQNFAGGVLILILKPYKVGDYIEAQGYAGTVKAIQIFHTVINTIDNKAIIIPNGGLSTSSINNYSLEQYRRVDWTVSLSYGTDFDAARRVILDMLLTDDRVVKLYVEDDREERIRRHLDEETQQREECEQKLVDQTAVAPWWRRLALRSRLRRTRRENVQMQERHEAATTVKVERPPFVALAELADSSINITVRAWTHTSNYWSLYFDMNRRFYTELPDHGFSFPFPQMDVHLSH